MPTEFTWLIAVVGIVMIRELLLLLLGKESLHGVLNVSMVTVAFFAVGVFGWGGMKAFPPKGADVYWSATSAIMASLAFLALTLQTNRISESAEKTLAGEILLDRKKALQGLLEEVEQNQLALKRDPQAKIHRSRLELAMPYIQELPGGVSRALRNAYVLADCAGDGRDLERFACAATDLKEFLSGGAMKCEPLTASSLLKSNGSVRA